MKRGGLPQIIEGKVAGLKPSHGPRQRQTGGSNAASATSESSAGSQTLKLPDLAERRSGKSKSIGRSSESLVLPTIEQHVRSRRGNMGSRGELRPPASRSSRKSPGLSLPLRPSPLLLPIEVSVLSIDGNTPADDGSRSGDRTTKQVVFKDQIPCEARQRSDIRHAGAPAYLHANKARWVCPRALSHQLAYHANTGRKAQFLPDSPPFGGKSQSTAGSEGTTINTDDVDRSVPIPVKTMELRLRKKKRNVSKRPGSEFAFGARREKVRPKDPRRLTSRPSEPILTRPALKKMKPAYVPDTRKMGLPAPELRDPKLTGPQISDPRFVQASRHRITSQIPTNKKFVRKFVAEEMDVPRRRREGQRIQTIGARLQGNLESLHREHAELVVRKKIASLDESHAENMECFRRNATLELGKESHDIEQEAVAELEDAMKALDSLDSRLDHENLQMNEEERMWKFGDGLKLHREELVDLARKRQDKSLDELCREELQKCERQTFMETERHNLDSLVPLECALDFTTDIIHEATTSFYQDLLRKFNQDLEEKILGLVWKSAQTKKDAEQSADDFEDTKGDFRRWFNTTEGMGTSDGITTIAPGEHWKKQPFQWIR